MWKDMASLTDKAPKFDGTEDVLFWLNSMRRYYKRNKIDDIHMRREILIGSLKGVAQEWFNALDDNECDQYDLEDICKQINTRFGKTRIQKLRAFDALKQKAGETNTQYADRVRKASLGLARDPEDIVYKYLTTLTHSSSIYDFVINHAPKNL
jgi:hypothetical protein